MNRKTATPDFGTPPREYSFGYMLSLLRNLDQFRQQVMTPGDAVEGTLTLLAWPASGYGLPVGRQWLDGSGYVRAVRASDTFAPSLAINPKIGTAVAA